MMTAVARWLIPAALLDLLNSLLRRSKLHRKKLLEQSADSENYKSEDWSIFRFAMAECTNLLEYGSGHSTEFAAKNFNCHVRSIETDANWAMELTSLAMSEVEVIHVDLGPVGNWGRPLSYARRDKFQNYLSAGFENDFNPDVVLIDGRFRVASFCFAILNSRAGTRIVFDDYVNRPQYHIVEEILSPNERGKRQALFIRPEDVDLKQVEELLRDFKMVMD